MSSVTTPDVKVLSLDESDEALLPQFVATAHLHVSFVQHEGLLDVTLDRSGRKSKFVGWRLDRIEMVFDKRRFCCEPDGVCRYRNKPCEKI